VPAEGVQHERVEVVAKEAEDEVEEREWGLGTEDQGLRTRGRTHRGDLRGRGVEQEGKSIEAGGV
jgi:hypothetical protein